MLGCDHSHSLSILSKKQCAGAYGWAPAALPIALFFRFIFWCYSRIGGGLMGWITLAVLLTMMVAYATDIKERNDCKDD